MRGSISRARSLARLFALLALVTGAALATGACSRHQLEPVATITYQLKPQDGTAVTPADLTAVATILERRLAGFEGIRVEAAAPDHVFVGLPTEEYRARVEGIASPTGLVEFILLPPELYGTKTTSGTTAFPHVGEKVDPSLSARWTGNQLDTSETKTYWGTNTNGAWLVRYAFRPEFTASFENWTGEHAGDYLAITMDRVIVDVVSIEGAFTGGTGAIDGGFTSKSAMDFAVILAGGVLPVPIVEVSFDAGWRE